LDDSHAIIVTTDFFTPVVDDAYHYGAIAAANSLSDIYAMGGNPFLALNIAALPDDLPVEISSEIIKGGAEKAREAGVVIAGGHTIKDKEPKYGLVALGFIDPSKIMSKGGLASGDHLILTKPLGFGVTTTALKREQADEKDVQEAIEWMMKLNNKASHLAVEFDLKGATDITGYSLLGHGTEMANASNVKLEIEFAKIPFISCAKKYADLGSFPGGALDNKNHFEKNVEFAEGLSVQEKMLLFDPQTSGGLLLGVPQNKFENFMERAKELDQPLWVIGNVVDGRGISIR